MVAAPVNLNEPVCAVSTSAYGNRITWAWRYPVRAGKNSENMDMNVAASM